MNHITEDIKDILEAESSLGLEFGENLFIGREMDTPINCVTIFDIPGFPPEVTLTQDTDYEKPAINIRVRNAHYGAGAILINAIKNCLHNRGNEVWNGTMYTSILCQGEPALLDWQSNNIARFVVNFNIQRRTA